MDAFQNNLKIKMDDYTHLIYKLTRKFPKEELYGVTSQIRRASLSIVLNYIEGFARRKQAVKRNFWEISYGSLKESKYLLYFAVKEKYITNKEYKNAIKLVEEIGAMLWHSLRSIK